MKQYVVFLEFLHTPSALGDDTLSLLLHLFPPVIHIWLFVASSHLKHAKGRSSYLLRAFLSGITAHRKHFPEQEREHLKIIRLSDPKRSCIFQCLVITWHWRLGNTLDVSISCLVSQWQPSHSDDPIWLHCIWKLSQIAFSIWFEMAFKLPMQHNMVSDVCASPLRLNCLPNGLLIWLHVSLGCVWGIK